jgi:hypothetical protein
MDCEIFSLFPSTTTSEVASTLSLLSRSPPLLKDFQHDLPAMQQVTPALTPFNRSSPSGFQFVSAAVIAAVSIVAVIAAGAVKAAGNCSYADLQLCFYQLPSSAFPPSAACL